MCCLRLGFGLRSSMQYAEAFVGFQFVSCFVRVKGVVPSLRTYTVMFLVEPSDKMPQFTVEVALVHPWSQ